MGLPAKTKKQLEKEILETLAEYHRSSGDSMESRRQTLLLRLGEKVFTWCRDYIYKSQANEMGLEIFKALKSCVETPTAPKEGNDFFAYLKIAINNENIKSLLEYQPEKLRIPEGKVRKLNEINQVLAMAMHDKGRELTNDEQIECIKQWFNITAVKAKEYLTLQNMVHISSLDHYTNDDEALGPLTKADSEAPYLPGTPDDPQAVYENKYAAGELMQARKTVFMRKSKKMHDYLRELLTVKHIKTFIRVEEEFPFIDTHILETYLKNGQLPTQYEVYKKYHPKVTQGSAEASASARLEEFAKEVRLELEKNHLILPKKR